MPIRILALLALALPAGAIQVEAAAPRAQSSALAAPSELFEIERVVDGDTLWIQRAGALEKLRLLSVDTEEKLAFEGSDTKPGTVFGEETSLWAQDFFAARAAREGRARIGLLFPGGVEQRDPYGRLLCHVLLEDGADFNVLLVREGKSPYFNKYGNSTLCHAEFVRAQAAARAEGLGIWDPRTNAPATPGAPSAKRPYAELGAWWDLRAAAVDDYRAARAADPAHVAATDEPEALAEVLAAGGRGARIFGLVERVFEEDDGSRTVLFRSGDPKRAFRLIVPSERRAAFAELDFEGFGREFEQNYVWLQGALEAGPRGGFAMRAEDPAQVARARSLAEPAEPVEAASGGLGAGAR